MEKISFVDKVSNEVLQKQKKEQEYFTYCSVSAVFVPD